MADGKSKHSVVLGDNDKHELKLEVDGIRGAVDDYDEQNKLLIEKKTILSFKFLDKPRDEHIKQVLAYAYMLRKSGYEVDKAIIIYILRTMEEMPKQFEININDYDLNSFWSEMVKKANTILKHIKDKTLPPRKISWYCNYCNYTDLCFTRGELA
jgi:CRISPR/Cas system-associated exonuclease Cas4 (RecB family)